jgi:hypothetical protein
MSILTMLAEVAADPIAVSQSGITGGAKLICGSIVAGFVSVIAVFLKMRLPMRKLALASDEQLRADLMAQRREQDADHTARVARLEGRLDDQKKAYETKLEYERVLHANDLATMRHRMNNLDQCLTMLLALIEENPEKAQQAAKRVREMREKQEASESAEKALLNAARASLAVPTIPSALP